MLRLQDAPPDAAPAHLASLGTTEDLLQALRGAWGARTAVQAGSSPVHHRFQVPSLSWTPGQQDLTVYERCTKLQLSPCGAYMAVCISGRPCSRFAKLHEVVIYEIRGRDEVKYEITTRVSCGTSKPEVQWAASATHLSIAVSPFPRDHHPKAATPQFHAAAVFEASSGKVLAALTPQTTSSAEPLAVPLRSSKSRRNSGVQSHIAWAPCGRRLVLVQQAFKSASDSQGAVRLYDFWEDRAVAESAFVTEGRVGASEVCHISHAGLVLGSGARLKEPAAFKTAGVPVGILPHGCIAQQRSGLGFSPCSRYYLAEAAPGSQLPESELNSHEEPGLRFCLFESFVGGGQIGFSGVQVIEMQYNIHWGPRSLEAILNLDTDGPNSDLSFVTDILSYPERAVLWELLAKGGDTGYEALPLKLPLSFSPSGNFMCASFRGPSVFCLKTGKLLWSFITPKLPSPIVWSEESCSRSPPEHWLRSSDDEEPEPEPYLHRCRCWVGCRQAAG